MLFLFPLSLLSLSILFFSFLLYLSFSFFRSYFYALWYTVRFFLLFEQFERFETRRMTIFISFLRIDSSVSASRSFSLSLFSLSLITLSFPFNHTKSESRTRRFFKIALLYLKLNIRELRINKKAKYTYIHFYN